MNLGTSSTMRDLLCLCPHLETPLTRKVPHCRRGCTPAASWSPGPLSGAITAVWAHSMCVKIIFYHLTIAYSPFLFPLPFPSVSYSLPEPPGGGLNFPLGHTPHTKALMFLQQSSQGSCLSLLSLCLCRSILSLCSFLSRQSGSPACARFFLEAQRVNLLSQSLSCCCEERSQPG